MLLFKQLKPKCTKFHWFFLFIIYFIFEKNTLISPGNGISPIPWWISRIEPSPMRIELHTFDILTDIEKTEMVLDNGTFMLKRQDKDHVISLYTLSDFYVEMYYDQKSNRIIKIKSFKSTEPLDPYLGDIDIGNHLL